ncbi:MAG TPA: hypothetical protein VG389_29625 [Myxococcota bacterium]|jgi:hypothetical protein|nr:hypothetical protein [Myxococcota bacterium]
MRDIAQKLDEASRAAGAADADGAARAFAEALTLAERSAARVDAIELLVKAAPALCDGLGSALPVRWAVEAAAQLAVPIGPGVLAPLAAAWKRHQRGFEGPVGWEAYAEAMERLAHAEEAAGGRARADTLRASAWELAQALDLREDRGSMDRFVPVALAAKVRSLFGKVRRKYADPLKLVGTRNPDHALWGELWCQHDSEGLQRGVLGLAVADELAADGDAAGARWAVELATVLAFEVSDEGDIGCEELLAFTRLAVTGALRHGGARVGEVLAPHLKRFGCAVPADLQHSLDELARQPPSAAPPTKAGGGDGATRGRRPKRARGAS